MDIEVIPERYSPEASTVTLSMMISLRRAAGVTTLLSLTACSLSPMHNRIDVGEEPFALFVAEDRHGQTDLFAILPGGGEVTRVTFTSLVEHAPRLSGRGEVVAFLRDEGESTALLALNLLNGAERRIELPVEAGRPLEVTWSSDDTELLVHTSVGIWRAPAPPSRGDAAMVTGDSAGLAAMFRVDLGRSNFAEAVECENGAGICVRGADGLPTRLSAQGHDPFRWGNDSLAWFEGDQMLIRPLGPGPARQVTVSGVVAPRQGSHAEPGPTT